MQIRGKRFLRIHLTVLGVAAVYYILPFGCPVKYFLHFECPTCGMTRAMLSLLKGDIAGYFSYNPAALPFLLVLLFAVHKDLLPFKPKTKNAVLIIGTIGVVIVYFLRLFLCKK